MYHCRALKINHKFPQLVESYCNAYCKTILEKTGVNNVWIINNSLDVLHTLDEKQLSLKKVSTWDFSTLYTSLHMPNSNFSCMIYWKEFLPPEEKAALPPIAITPSGRMIGSLRNTLTLLADNFPLPLTFLSTISTSALESHLVYPWVLTVRLYWLTCFSTLSCTISCLKLWQQTCQKLSNLAPPFVTSTIYSASITTTLEISVKFKNLSVKFIRRSWNSRILPSVQQRCVIWTQK